MTLFDRRDSPLDKSFEDKKKPTFGAQRRLIGDSRLAKRAYSIDSSL